jgi:dipeptidyl aminopeptidase/acylaminoacyl peptidase
MKIARCCLPAFFFLTTVLVATSAAEPKRAFTLQQVLSAPFPSDLVAAHTKNRFAWVFNAEGKRNVWIAEPTAKCGFSSRAITKYSDDDGQDIGELAFTPDSESIVYTRGGDLEFSEKPAPNPSKLVDGAEQDVWIVALNGGEPKKIGEGHSAAISPKGGAVAYVLKGQIWLVKLDSSEKPVQLMHAHGEVSTLRWSPDGTSLAFVSHRGDHAFIGIYSFTAKSISYPDPSTDRDTEPVWSPDGHSIAFLRIPSSKDDLLFKPKRAGAPWSIRIIDVGSETGHELWKSTDGPGSVFREVTAENQLLWGAGNTIVFPWERDGWTHLYSVSVSGKGTPVLLTPGGFEVEDVSLSPDLQSVVYSSNQDDIDRRHIWRIPVAGGAATALTSGPEIETAGVTSSDGKTVAILRSDARVPMRPAVIAGRNDIRDIAAETIPGDFPAAQLVTPQQVIFAAADGMPIHGQLFLPANDGTGRHPAAIFFHGGSERQMLLGWHYMDYYSNAYAMNQYLASRGYVVLSVNYRSGIGYGLNFREALNYGATGASEYNDVQGAGLYLRSRGDVEPNRIGVWGGSYGGYLTALALARSSDLFAAGVDMHGVHNWNEELKNWGPYEPAGNSEFARLAWESSPMASIQNWRSPVLLVHGDDDRNVPFSETVNLVDALRQQGVHFEELILPDEIHGFLLHKSWLAAYGATATFFDKQLKK